MTNTKQIIITLNAKALFDYFPKKPTENNQCFKLDFSDPVHSYVVTQEITREDCFLFFSQQSSHPHHKHKNHTQIAPIRILSIHLQSAALSPV